MEETQKSSTRSLILILSVASLLLTTAFQSMAQPAEVKILVGEKRNSHKQVTFNVGQTASYKTARDNLFHKGVIQEITDSTISFTMTKGEVLMVPLKDLKELKAQRPGRKGGGIALVAAGIAGTVLGLIIIAIVDSNSGVGTVVAGGAVLVVSGIILLQPDQANTATLKVQTKQESVH